MSDFSDAYDFITDSAEEGVYIPIPSGGNLTVDISGMNTKQIRGHFQRYFYNKDSDGNFVDATPTAGTCEFHWRYDSGHPWSDTEAGAVDVSTDSTVVRADTAYRDARMVLTGVTGASYVRAICIRWEG